ncbi:MAG: SLC13 family permease [Candidatus Hodarchaeales archaeon]
MTLCFLTVALLILLDKNRAIVAISGALVTYAVLIYLEGFDFSVIVELLVGSNSDGYVNLHSILLILGMMFIVNTSDEIGTFQFLAVIAIKLSKGRPIPLMIILAFLSLIFSAILNNILTVMILIPLTITISRVLNVSPTPYIITQAIMVNIGGTIFSISSIPNILIMTTANISFNEYFLNNGLLSIVVFAFSCIVFIFLYKKDLTIPMDMAIQTLLEDFDIWNVVQSKRLLYSSLGSLILLMIMFVLIPSSVISPDFIALSIAMLLTILSGLDSKKIIERLDFELVMYLFGIFVIAGGLEKMKVLDTLSDILGIFEGNSLLQLILILWLGAITSSMIDNVPITKVLIPVVNNISQGSSIYYYSLSIGANWGDNLTPLGDNILVLSIAEDNNRPISPKTFFKLGFTMTILQLLMATLYFILLLEFLLGLSIIALISVILLILAVLNEKGPVKIQNRLKRSIKKIRRTIIA